MSEKSKEKTNETKKRTINDKTKFKKVTSKENNKLNKVILTILLLLVILVVAIGIVFGGRIINKVKLDRELENLVSKDISTEELSNENLVTSGDFAVVEQTIKDYFKDYSELRKQFMDKVNDTKLQSILTPENYNQDGPDFAESISYINTTKEEFNSIADKLLDLLSKENIVARIENEDISDYYKDLYKGYLIENNDLSKTFQESYQDTVDDKILMNNLYDNEIKILNFLTENKGHWEVLDNKLTFDNQELANTFNEMKSNLYEE